VNISVDATMKKIALNMSVATDTGSGKHQSEMFILQDFATVSSKRSLKVILETRHVYLISTFYYY
jgi:hypothetical protein